MKCCPFAVDYSREDRGRLARAVGRPKVRKVTWNNAIMRIDELASIDDASCSRPIIDCHQHYFEELLGFFVVESSLSILRARIGSSGNSLRYAKVNRFTIKG